MQAEKLAEAQGFEFRLHQIAANEPVQMLPFNLNSSAATRCPRQRVPVGRTRLQEPKIRLLDSLRAQDAHSGFSLGSESSSSTISSIGPASTVSGSVGLLSTVTTDDLVAAITAARIRAQSLRGAGPAPLMTVRGKTGRSHSIVASPPTLQERLSMKLKVLPAAQSAAPKSSKMHVAAGAVRVAGGTGIGKAGKGLKLTVI